MIRTVTLHPYIEKRTYGKINKLEEFEPVQTTYELGGSGLQVSKILDSYKIENTAHVLVGTNIDTLSNKPYIQAVHSAITTPTRLTMLEEEEVLGVLTDEAIRLSDDELTLFCSVVNSSIEEHDIVSLIEEEGIMTHQQMEFVYQTLCQKNPIVICSLHTRYIRILQEHACNVCILTIKQLEELYIRDYDVTLTKWILTLEKQLMKLAKIVVISVSSNVIYICKDDELYQAKHPTEDPKQQVYIDAIASGVLKCYQEQGDMRQLLKLCLSFSVGSSLSTGLYVPSKEVLQLIEQKIQIHKINEIDNISE